MYNTLFVIHTIIKCKFKKKWLYQEYEIIVINKLQYNCKMFLSDFISII